MKTLHMKLSITTASIALLSALLPVASAQELELKPTQVPDNNYQIARVTFLPDWFDKSQDKPFDGMDINQDSKYCAALGFIYAPSGNCGDKSAVTEICPRDSNYVKCDEEKWCTDHGYLYCGDTENDRACPSLSDRFSVTKCQLPTFIDSATQCPNGAPLYSSCKTDNNKACKDTGFQTSCTPPEKLYASGYDNNKQCTWNKNYRKCCNPGTLGTCETKYPNSSLDCTGTIAGKDGCGYECKKCCETACDGFSKYTASNIPSGYVQDGSETCNKCNTGKLVKIKPATCPPSYSLCASTGPGSGALSCNSAGTITYSKCCSPQCPAENNVCISTVNNGCGGYCTGNYSDIYILNGSGGNYEFAPNAGCNKKYKLTGTFDHIVFPEEGYTGSCTSPQCTFTNPDAMHQINGTVAYVGTAPLKVGTIELGNNGFSGVKTSGHHIFNIPLQTQTVNIVAGNTFEFNKSYSVKEYYFWNNGGSMPIPNLNYGSSAVWFWKFGTHTISAPLTIKQLVLGGSANKKEVVVSGNPITITYLLSIFSDVVFENEITVNGTITFYEDTPGEITHKVTFKKGIKGTYKCQTYTAGTSPISINADCPF